MPAPSSRQLDDVERDARRRSVLAGDAAIEAHATARVHRLPSTDAGEPLDERDDSRLVLDLAGTWLLAGATPRRQFSIEHWAERGDAKPQGDPVDWYRTGTDRTEWVEAAVPGTVQGALVEAGLLPDPLLDGNTYDELTAHGVPERWPWFFRRTRVEQQEWWYARRFQLPAEWRDRRARLVFDGIDYSATVYVNGEPASRHTGMFGGPEVDITSLLEVGAENEVVVRISPPPHDWHGVMKGSPGWGWHYGHLISMGIWRGVRIESIPETEVRDPFVATASIFGGSARIRVQADVVAREEADRPATGLLTLRGPAGETVAARTFELRPREGLNRIELDVEVPDARLWWPFGYGDQPLYEATVSFGDGAASTSFGIRTVEMAPVPDWTGEEHYRWRFVINGRPLFVKGANWCWTDPLARRPFAVDAHLLDLTVQGGIQMLRAWGGGIVESERFYRECDRLGILVYQEFPLTFGLPDASGVDLAVIDEQVSRIVRALRSHPSLVMWGGGNENPLPISGDDPLILIGRRVAHYDDSRPFHRTSPWGGDEHNYRVYHEGEPIDSGYRSVDAVVLGEYGLSSQCDVESMAEFLDPALLEQWPPPADGAILQHQAQFSLVDVLKQLRYADYGPVRDWRTFIEYSQVAQGEALRFASELVRSGSGEHTSAYWFYKLGEVFPGASWAVVDYYGRPKLSYYQVKRFSAARSAFAVAERLDWAPGEEFTAAVHVANDTPAAFDGRVTARLWDARLRSHADVDEAVHVDADGRVSPFSVSAVVPAEAAPLLLSVRLESDDGELVSDQWYWFNAHAKPDAVRQVEARPIDDLWDLDVRPLIEAYAEDRPAPLLTLPRTDLVARAADGRLEVTNRGAVPAVQVMVDGFPHGVGSLLDDNGFGLLPGETRMVGFRTADGTLPALSVRAWNADPVAAA
jgi:beta-galactosidase/beta-glucuronidase